MISSDWFYCLQGLLPIPQDIISNNYWYSINSIEIDQKRTEQMKEFWAKKKKEQGRRLTVMEEITGIL